MNAKQIFAIILTILGVGALIYTAVEVMNSGADSIKNLIVIGIMGIIFFSAGIKLLRST